LWESGSAILAELGGRTLGAQNRIWEMVAKADFHPSIALSGKSFGLPQNRQKRSELKAVGGDGGIRTPDTVVNRITV
jgi:hypothetical protein